MFDLSFSENVNAVEVFEKMARLQFEVTKLQDELFLYKLGNLILLGALLIISLIMLYWSIREKYNIEFTLKKKGVANECEE